MQEIPALITDLTIILVVAALTTLLCKKINLPSVLGYILAGFLAGPVGSALGMVLLGLVSKWLWQMELPLWYLAVIGIAANLFGQLGDLSMSLIKREAGIKDYSHIFLTHGGVLDRFDSILFIAPVVYAAVMWMEAVL